VASRRRGGDDGGKRRLRRGLGFRRRRGCTGQRLGFLVPRIPGWRCLIKAGAPPWRAGHAWRGVRGADASAPELGLESGSGTDMAAGMTGRPRLSAAAPRASGRGLAAAVWAGWASSAWRDGLSWEKKNWACSLLGLKRKKNKRAAVRRAAAGLLGLKRGKGIG
jgi:hypothetical protein